MILTQNKYLLLRTEHNLPRLLQWYPEKVAEKQTIARVKKNKVVTVSQPELAARMRNKLDMNAPIIDWLILRTIVTGRRPFRITQSVVYETNRIEELLQSQGTQLKIPVCKHEMRYLHHFKDPVPTWWLSNWVLPFGL